MSGKKGHRQFAGDIDGVLEHYRNRAQVVQLWWHKDAWSPWMYIGRLRLDDYRPFSDFLFMELVQSRFGGGWYRARIYGEWDRRARREEYLEQVSFGVDGPVTAETLALIRRSQASESQGRTRHR